MKYCKCKQPELMVTRCRKCNLEMQTSKRESFSEMEEKKNKLYSSGQYEEAIKIQAKIDFLHWGII